MKHPFSLGTLPFGSVVDEPTSIALLDRYVEAGGTLLDTANNYVDWLDGFTGDESELLLGRWMARRRNRDEVELVTKLGARLTPDGTHQGLSPDTIRASLAASLRRLGTDRVELYYAHIPDARTPLAETVETFSELVAGGTVGRVGCSNHSTALIRRARALAAEHGRTPFTAVQQRYTYLRPSPGADFGVMEHVDDELLTYAAGEPDLDLFGYSTLVFGAYVRADRALPAQYEHPGSTRRLAVLREVAAELGHTPNQVVLAWLLGGEPAITPVVGVSSIAQLDEAITATDLDLPAEIRTRLDQA